MGCTSSTTLESVTEDFRDDSLHLRGCLTDEADSISSSYLTTSNCSSKSGNCLSPVTTHSLTSEPVTTAAATAESATVASAFVPSEPKIAKSISASAPPFSSVFSSSSSSSDSCSFSTHTTFAPGDLQYLSPLCSISNGSYVVRARVKRSGLECAVKVMAVSRHCDLKAIERDLKKLHGCLEKHKEISHYIVDYYGAFIQNGRLRVVMELMSGSLQQLVGRKLEIPEEILASIMKLLLTGVDYLHRTLRVLHRDIKPSNVLFNYRDGCVKISDFAVSATLGPTDTQCTCTMVVGTMRYMSPERLDGGSYTFTADIWGVGLVCLELAQSSNLSKSQPAATIELSSEQQEFTSSISTGSIANFLESNGAPCLHSDHLRRYSAELRRFLSCCLRLDPNLRPSADALLAHEWIVSNTMSEESFDEARLHHWLCSAVRTPTGHHCTPVGIL